jgi:hypothetical protein
MASVILTHLGESIPLYIKDCVHQLRLWNKTTPIYIIQEPYHKKEIFWQNLYLQYNVIYVYTDSLEPTEHHKEFQRGYSGDTAFRKGYWKHVRERFFYVEELMMRESLKDAISMEYDIMVYCCLDDLKKKFQQSHQTIRMVMDNASRGHPGFMYIPSSLEMRNFTMFMTCLLGLNYEDMQSLSLYSRIFEVHYLPVITEERNRANPNRRSQVGDTSKDPFFLSEDSEHFGCLFDSLVVGQFLGGIDPRNTGGHKYVHYENEGALYRIREMDFQWKKDTILGLWQPWLDNRPLVTIHMHSKALNCFLSDRTDCPSPDYQVDSLYRSLLPN